MLRTYNRRHRCLASASRQNQTDAEHRLWQCLRRRQIADARFLRQRPIGPYILDFYCPALRLCIELDGGQHFEAEGKTSDRKRDSWLARQGIHVMRFTNRDVLQETEAVLQAIADRVQALRGTPL